MIGWNKAYNIKKVKEKLSDRYLKRITTKDR